MARIKRRNFPGGLAGGLVAHPVLSRAVWAQAEETVTIQWRVPREQVKTVRQDLDFQGEITPDESTIEDDRGLPLIYVFVGVAAVGALAKTLLDIYKDARYGGVIVSKNEQGKVVIENDPRLEKGTIIINQGDEIKVIFKEQDNPQATELIKALTPLVGK